MYVYVCVCVKVTRSCLTLCNPMDCSPLIYRFLCPWNSLGKTIGVGSHSLLQERSSQPRAWTQVSCIAGRFFTVWVAAAAAAKSLQSCLTVRPHRWQPTRLSCPWDSPGKTTGVGCHFLLQCMKVKSESEVAQSCPTLSDPMDCSPPGPPSVGFSRQEYHFLLAISFSIMMMLVPS